ncbi:Uncharacterised protein [Streptococcus pneumoniae]|nr:Uncharacterised protein [Streptococcus pneumoniae]
MAVKMKTAYSKMKKQDVTAKYVEEHPQLKEGLEFT